MIQLSDICQGQILEVQSIEVLEDGFGVILKVRVLVEIGKAQVGLNLNLKTNSGEVSRLFSLTKQKLSQKS